MENAHIIDWTRHFDRIYCFHFLPDAARLPGITAELDRVGILKSGIFSFVYTSPDPWERFIARNCRRIASDETSNDGFVNLGLASARTLREALALGYGRVLFLENDIRFLKDISEVERIVALTPTDCNICQYDKFLPWDMKPEDYRRKVSERRINEAFYDGGSDFLASGGCFSADRIGMKGLLEVLENEGPRPVDGLFGKICAKRAVADRNAAIQVCYDDALVFKYLRKGNTHHKAYAPMELDYALYNVPDGYGYEVRTVDVARG